MKRRKTLIRIATALLLLASPLVASAQDDPYAPIAPPPSGEVETTEPTNLLNPNVSAITSLAFGYFSGTTLTPIGHDPARTGITLQEIELGFQAPIDPYFRADLFLSLSEHGFHVCEGTITTLALPTGFQLEVGQLAAEFGRQNPSHLETWDFADNNLPNSLLLGYKIHPLGVELSYLVPTGTRDVYLRIVAEALDAHSLSLGGTYHHEHEAEEEHEEEEHEEEEHEHSHDAGGDTSAFDEVQVAALTRIESSFTFSPEWTLVWGISGLFGPNLAADEDWGTRLYGTDLYLRYRDSTGMGYTTVALAAEGMRLERDFHDETILDHGLSGILSWRFALRWDTALRFDLVDGDTVGEIMRSSGQLSFAPSEFSRIRAQYNALFPNNSSDDMEHQAFLQLEFSIGPHGAHPF